MPDCLLFLHRLETSTFDSITLLHRLETSTSDSFLFYTQAGDLYA